MNRKLEVFIDNSHEYTYEFDGEYHRLYYSENLEWTLPGDIAISIQETQEGYKIPEGLIDYSDACQLHIILSIIHSDQDFEVAQKIKL